MEQPFGAFSWVNPADADWMDLNIPEHRIEYFKYNGELIIHFISIMGPE